MQIRFHLEGQNIIKIQQKVRPPFIYLYCHLQWQLSVFTPPTLSPDPRGGEDGGVGWVGGAGEGGRAQGEHLSAALHRSAARLIEFMVENGATTLECLSSSFFSSPLPLLRACASVRFPPLLPALPTIRPSPRSPLSLPLWAGLRSQRRSNLSL